MEAYETRTREGTQRRTSPPSLGAPVRPADVVRMPISEIMQRAAANNSEVRVAGYEPAINETKIVEDEAHYDPIFFSNVRYDKQFDRTPGTVIPDPNNPTTNITITVEDNNIYTAEVGVKQYLPSGGQISLSQQMTSSYYNPVRYVLNNYFDQQLKLQLTQPLLRQFGYEVNWARITIARNDQRISLLDFRKSLEDNTNELEKDYWQLYEAQQEVEVQEALLEQTRELANLLWEQSIIGGKATHVEASQGVAAVYQREQLLVRAKAHAQDLSDDIKRRMGDPEFPVAGPIVILPADLPVEESVHFDLQDQIDTAMLNRLELGQQQIRINSSEVAKQVAFNGLYPKLDFVASAAVQGLSHDFSTAFSDQLSKGHGIYSAGLQLEIPLGNREGWAIYRRAQLQRMQAIEAYRNLMNQIDEDVTTAVREVDTTWGELRAARQARFRQQDVLDGLNQRRLSGVQRLDPEFIQLSLDQQERLAESRRQEATAVSNYNIALARLEKAKGTILRYNNIIMKEETDIWNLPATHSQMLDTDTSHSIIRPSK
jgi:outer membrane protein TolC